MFLEPGKFWIGECSLGLPVAHACVAAFDALAAVGEVNAVRREALISWIRPPDGFVVLNTDGAFRRNSLLATAGGVFRSQNGIWLGGFLVKLAIVTLLEWNFRVFTLVCRKHERMGGTREANTIADHMANLAFDQIDRFIWYDGPLSSASLLLFGDIIGAARPRMIRS
ncbi:unnamed protein product [Fraxinus pennsylvanica]|uniref:RNase H type-1 domain-containing protein n=1 Tax=Fraxinus pennsylvanica TaxID=56036 RepID=A0AAD2A9Q2_9LAMI|nr:unnamed protein product [Fraxinus pennsylvanica]